MATRIGAAQEEATPSADRTEEALQDQEEIARIDVRYERRDALASLEDCDPKAFCFLAAIHGQQEYRASAGESIRRSAPALFDALRPAPDVSGTRWLRRYGASPPPPHQPFLKPYLMSRRSWSLTSPTSRA